MLNEDYKKELKNIKYIGRKNPNITKMILDFLNKEIKEIKLKNDIKNKFDIAEETLLKIINHHQILKNKKVQLSINNFNSLEDIEDKVNKVLSEHRFEKIIKQIIPKKKRDILTEKSINDLKWLIVDKQKDEGFIQEKIGKRINAFNNQDSFDNYMELIKKEILFEFKKENVIKEITKNNQEIIHNESNLLIAEITEYSASQNLGSPNWCISYSKMHFNSYLKSKNNELEVKIGVDAENQVRQYFIWDFKKTNSNPLHLIGITLKNNQYQEGYNSQNNTLKNNEKIKNIIEIINFENIKQKRFNNINDLTTNEIKYRIMNYDLENSERVELSYKYCFDEIDNKTYKKWLKSMLLNFKQKNDMAINKSIPHIFNLFGKKELQGIILNANSGINLKIELLEKFRLFNKGEKIIEKLFTNLTDEKDIEFVLSEKIHPKTLKNNLSNEQIINLIDKSNKNLSDKLKLEIIYEIKIDNKNHLLDNIKSIDDFYNFFIINKEKFLNNYSNNFLFKVIDQSAIKRNYKIELTINYLNPIKSLEHFDYVHEKYGLSHVVWGLKFQSLYKKLNEKRMLNKKNLELLNEKLDIYFLEDYDSYSVIKGLKKEIQEQLKKVNKPKINK